MLVTDQRAVRHSKKRSAVPNHSLFRDFIPGRPRYWRECGSSFPKVFVDSCQSPCVDSTWQDAHGDEVSPVFHVVGRTLSPTDSRGSVNILPRYRWPTRRPRFNMNIVNKASCAELPPGSSTVLQAHSNDFTIPATGDHTRVCFGIKVVRWMSLRWLALFANQR